MARKKQVEDVHAILDERGDYVGAVLASDLGRLYRVPVNELASLFLPYGHSLGVTLHIDSEPMCADHTMYRSAHDDGRVTRGELDIFFGTTAAAVAKKKKKKKKPAPVGLGRHPWVDRAVELAWDRIEAEVGPELMPREEDCDFADPDDLNIEQFDPWRPDEEVPEGELGDDALLDARGRCVEEFGCGHFGCVMPTWTEGRVLKITTDASEAFFAAQAMAIGSGSTQVGAPAYSAVYRVKWAQRDGLPVFVLWRDEAYEIGFLADDDTPDGMLAKQLLVAAKGAGGEVRGLFAKALHATEAPGHRRANKLAIALADGLTDKTADYWLHSIEKANEIETAYYGPGDYAQDDIDLASALRRYAQAVDKLADHPKLRSVGHAMLYYLENGLVLGDVHFNNVGLDEDGVPFITDPGLCTPIHSDMFYADIPEI